MFNNMLVQTLLKSLKSFYLLSVFWVTIFKLLIFNSKKHKQSLQENVSLTTEFNNKKLLFTIVTNLNSE